VVAAHGTGWKAVHAITARMPDAAFIRKSVGTSFAFVAAPVAVPAAT